MLSCTFDSIVFARARDWISQLALKSILKDLLTAVFNDEWFFHPSDSDQLFCRQDVIKMGLIVPFEGNDGRSVWRTKSFSAAPKIPVIWANPQICCSYPVERELCRKSSIVYSPQLKE